MRSSEIALPRSSLVQERSTDLLCYRQLDKALISLLWEDASASMVCSAPGPLFVQVDWRPDYLLEIISLEEWRPGSGKFKLWPTCPLPGEGQSGLVWDFT